MNAMFFIHELPQKNVSILQREELCATVTSLLIIAVDISCSTLRRQFPVVMSRMLITVFFIISEKLQKLRSFESFDNKSESRTAAVKVE